MCSINLKFFELTTNEFYIVGIQFHCTCCFQKFNFRILVDPNYVLLFPSFLSTVDMDHTGFCATVDMGHTGFRATVDMGNTGFCATVDLIWVTLVSVQQRTHCHTNTSTYSLDFVYNLFSHSLLLSKNRIK